MNIFFFGSLIFRNLTNMLGHEKKFLWIYQVHVVVVFVAVVCLVRPLSCVSVVLLDLVGVGVVHEIDIRTEVPS